MPRPLYIPNESLPYHVTARSHNKMPFAMPLDELWKLFCDEFYYLNLFYGFKIHSFVLMPNHFHLLVTTPETNLPEGMCHFMTQISKKINTYSYKINQNFGGRHYKCLIPSDHYYLNAYKYVYRNPVKANLCTKVEEYPYSTIQMYLGLQTIKLPLAGDSLLMDDIKGTLDWLNTPHHEDDWNNMRAGLKKAELEFPRCRLTREPNRLESVLL